MIGLIIIDYLSLVVMKTEARRTDVLSISKRRELNRESDFL